MTVDVKLDGPAPEGTKPGQEVDGTIEIEKLDNITYVGRPVFGQPNSTASLFKVDPDGKGASLVEVRLQVVLRRTRSRSSAACSPPTR